MDYYPLVTQVIPHEDYTVDVSFSDGKTVTVNMLPQIVAGKQKNNLFARIADINNFMGRCTIINDTLAWDIGGKKDAWNSIDIDPISLWKLPETAELFQA